MNKHLNKLFSDIISDILEGVRKPSEYWVYMVLIKCKNKE